MRRLTDIYAQLAADRDAKAAMCAIYVNEKEWDRASAAAKDFQRLADQCGALIVGSLAILPDSSSDDPDPRSAA